MLSLLRTQLCRVTASRAVCNVTAMESEVTLDECKASPVPTIIDFYADWCELTFSNHGYNCNNHGSKHSAPNHEIMVKMYLVTIETVYLVTMVSMVTMVTTLSHHGFHGNHGNNKFSNHI